MTSPTMNKLMPWDGFLDYLYPSKKSKTVRLRPTMSNYKHQKKHFGIPDMTWILGKNYKKVKNRKSRKKEAV